MKLNIEIKNDHPALLHFSMIQDELEQIARNAKTPAHLIEALKTKLEGSAYFFGCGSSHLWIHHAAAKNDRIAIVYFPDEPNQGWTWRRVK